MVQNLLGTQTGFNNRGGGSNFFYFSSFEGNHFLLEPWQSTPLSKSENKLLEITRDPYFEDIEWKYCIFGAVQLGGRRGRREVFSKV